METPFQLAATIREPSHQRLATAIRRAAARADLLEVRLDAMESREGMPDLARIVRTAPLPVIYSCRRREDGGEWKGTEEERIALLREALRSGARYVDLEWDAGAAALLREPVPPGTGIVLSRHSVAGIPADLHDEASQMAGAVASRPDAIVKLAARVPSLPEARHLLDAGARIAEGGARVALAGMGPKGLPVRLLAPAAGAVLGYFSLERDPDDPLGQVGLEDAQNLYRVHKVRRGTTVAGILGSPVSRSLSPAMHNEGYKIRSLDWVYVPLEGTAEELRDLLRSAGSPALSWGGFSVTAPEKAAALRIADVVEEDAREIGAANTLILDGAGRLVAANTDAPGLLAALTDVPAHGGVGFRPKGARVAVLGAGGAARAAVWVLRRAGAEVIVYARDTGKAEAFASRFGSPVRAITAFDGAGFDLVVNATTCGAWPARDESPVGYSMMRGVRCACDLVTVPGRTRFLRDAEAHGAVTLEGVEVLARQGALQFQKMTGAEAPVRSMRQAARSLRGALEGGA